MNLNHSVNGRNTIVYFMNEILVSMQYIYLNNLKKYTRVPQIEHILKLVLAGITTEDNKDKTLMYKLSTRSIEEPVSFEEFTHLMNLIKVSDLAMELIDIDSPQSKLLDKITLLQTEVDIKISYSNLLEKRVAENLFKDFMNVIITPDDVEDLVKRIPIGIYTADTKVVDRFKGYSNAQIFIPDELEYLRKYMDMNIFNIQQNWQHYSIQK